MIPYDAAIGKPYLAMRTFSGSIDMSANRPRIFIVGAIYTEGVVLFEPHWYGCFAEQWHTAFVQGLQPCTNYAVPLLDLLQAAKELQTFRCTLGECRAHICDVIA